MKEEVSAQIEGAQVGQGRETHAEGVVGRSELSQVQVAQAEGLEGCDAAKCRAKHCDAGVVDQIEVEDQGGQVL